MYMFKAVTDKIILILTSDTLMLSIRGQNIIINAGIFTDLYFELIIYRFMYIK